jgi:hypothetical protein
VTRGMPQKACQFALAGQGALPPGCHGRPPQMEIDGTRRNRTGTVTWRKGCKSAPHHGFPIPFLQVRTLSRLHDFSQTWVPITVFIPAGGIGV